MINSENDIYLTYALSCNIEDAAMYLMGVPQRDLQLQWFLDPDDRSDGYWASIDAYQLLGENLETAESNLLEANYEKASDEVIAAKLAERDDCAAQVKLAHKYKTAIINELAKGVGYSSLHIDSTAMLDARNPFITLLSLKEWAKKSLNITILAELGPVTPTKKISKALQQENAILDSIKKLGHDLKSLPKYQPGKPGVKSDVRRQVQHPPLFDNPGIFDKTWERLLKNKDIINFK